MVLSLNIKKDLLTFLILQLLATLNALAVFRFIEERWLAALIAGSVFVILGVWMILRTLRWPNRFKMVTFYTARVHLFLFSLPMLIVRIKYFGVDFKQLHFLGLSGPQFHGLSEAFFLIMVAGTIIDFLRVRRWVQAP